MGKGSLFLLKPRGNVVRSRSAASGFNLVPCLSRSKDGGMFVLGMGHFCKLGGGLRGSPRGLRSTLGIVGILSAMRKADTLCPSDALGTKLLPFGSTGTSSAFCTSVSSFVGTKGAAPFVCSK